MIAAIIALLGAGGIGAAAVMYPPFGLLLLTAAKSALQWLSRRSLAEIICICLALALILTGYSRNHWKHVATTRQAQLLACQSGRASDRQAYANAQAEASRANKQQVQKIEQQYQRNSDDERQAYLDDLAKLRAGRVRQSQAPAAPGPAGAANAPEGDGAAPRIDASGLCVPATSDVCEAGAEIELRLMHLQNLSEQQSQVDPNK